jgi:hypothetical protein
MMSERKCFHRPSAQTLCESRVINDLATADVDAVMEIATAGHNKVRTQRRFLAVVNELVGSE